MAEEQFVDITGQTLTKHPGSLSGCAPLPSMVLPTVDLTGSMLALSQTPRTLHCRALT